MNKIMFTSAIMVLLVPALANAEIPKHTPQNSELLPYLLDSPDQNSTVRVRCLSRLRQAAIREYLLKPYESNSTADTVTIEIAGSCRHLKIRVEDDVSFDDYPVDNPYLDEHHTSFNDSWLTRKGSGWHWLLHHR
ncbi:hypothetical protein [Nostoc cycadae]|uniref:ABC transporter ATP-binding protein n=1 Tax=Nostoc cycadae WK-1 TaxID=1861711 RepID=A0A2H6LMD5_9NOSO|nr:hypothetical protein [Nostoc cycadae]GBE94380.1 ABC transporter ATP-binding protein [Nostoc cycadae WK-1]